MAYTSSDLSQIQAAILALSTGTRKVRVTIAGQTIEYGQASLSALRELRDEIKAEIATETDDTSNHCYISTSKGL